MQTEQNTDNKHCRAERQIKHRLLLKFRGKWYRCHDNKNSEPAIKPREIIQDGDHGDADGPVVFGDEFLSSKEI